MTKAKSYLPEGIRTVTPTLMLKNTLEAIEWYKKAFGAQVKSIASGPTQSGAPTGERTVVKQRPLPGYPITADTAIELILSR